MLASPLPSNGRRILSDLDGYIVGREAWQGGPDHELVARDVLLSGLPLCALRLTAS